VTSPLARCVETAALLGAPDAPREPRLAEMSWGAWEGRRLAELRAELGAAMRENEARGLDFRPEDGESPREVLARVYGWLTEVSAPTLAITHRGVIRAVLAAATGWDMRGPPPAKLDWSACHLFRVDEGVRVERLNVR
jgi:probable phosphoglycerate mutase